MPVARSLPCGATVGWSDPGPTTVRGSVTTARSWVDTTNGWLETHAQYDGCGNARKSLDAKGNVSQVEYSGDYHFAYPTRTISPVPDPSGLFGSTTALESSTVYDFTTGLVTSSTDTNGHTTSFNYDDPLNRLTLVTRPAGGG
ncbi:MAG: RHS repeat protein [Acidobacteriota bacterium]|nr:RHS repeat protein [Acidobacteriota bacterium]